MCKVATLTQQMLQRVHEKHQAVSNQTLCKATDGPEGEDAYLSDLTYTYMSGKDLFYYRFVMENNRQLNNKLSWI